MYRWVLIAHGAWRWVVIIAGVAAIAGALQGLRRQKPWAPTSARLGRLFGIAVDIQVLMGAVLYVVLSPLTAGGLRAPIVATSPSEVRFFAIEHISIMVLTLLAVHLSAVIIRKGRGDAARQRRAVMCYGLTLLILLSGIPWWRPWLRW
jgi:hypothetical protein